MWAIAAEQTGVNEAGDCGFNWYLQGISKTQFSIGKTMISLQGTSGRKSQYEPQYSCW